MSLCYNSDYGTYIVQLVFCTHDPEFAKFQASDRQRQQRSSSTRPDRSKAFSRSESMSGPPPAAARLACQICKPFEVVQLSSTFGSSFCEMPIRCASWVWLSAAGRATGNQKQLQSSGCFAKETASMLQDISTGQNFEAL